VSHATQGGFPPDPYQRLDNVTAGPARERRVADVQPTERQVRIAMLAPPWIPIPPPGYGGIEFVLTLLCDALVDRGHDVELFCAPGSSSKARVHPLLERPHPESIERSLFEATSGSRSTRSMRPPAAARRSTSCTTIAATRRWRWPTG
jgi:hypothetical protein